MSKKIINEAQKSLDEVLEFYEQQGTPLSYRPKIQYDPKYVCPDGEKTVSIIRLKRNMKRKSIDAMKGMLSGEYLREAYFKFYRAEMSDEEIKAVRTTFMRSLEGSSNNGREALRQIPLRTIILMNPYEELDRGRRNATLVHEVWHLIEEERHVIYEFPMIVEGTAQYAEYIFSGAKPFPIPIEECRNAASVLYGVAAYVVQEAVGKTSNPYRSMLNLEKREEINAKFVSQYASWMMPLVAKEQRRLVTIFRQ